MKPILVIGDVMLDRYLWGETNRISPEAPVPVIHIENITFAVGGAGNVAANVAGLGHEAILLGVAGKDDTVGILRAGLRNVGISDLLVEEQKRMTTMKTRVVARGQHLLRIDEESMEDTYAKTKDKLINKAKKVLPSCGAMIFSDYNKGVLWSEEFVEEIIGAAHMFGVPIFVDPKGRNWEKYSHTFCITPNLKEFQIYVATRELGAYIEKYSDLEHWTEALCEKLETDWMVITRGDAGIFVSKGPDGEEATSFAAAQVVEAADVSGAGDTFIAALATKVSEGASVKEAAQLANKAAGIVVGKVGTVAITKEEL
jgi:D-beta-D-heptose 7-phosphate kinase/D-beta-D-heptose 1-phosphate adenosyltransferase